MLRFLPALAALLLIPALTAPAADRPLSAGFAVADITPDVKDGKPVYMAGYGMNRKATGVHDPLYARTVVLGDGDTKFAIVSVDLVGLQFPQTKAIRARLPEFKYVLVGSTHNHEGPDVIGIWGRGPFHRGASEDYLDFVVERVVASVKEAAGKLAPVTAAFGTATDESLMDDSRLPIVKDGVLRLIKLTKAGSSDAAGLLVQWNCHPESLGSKNTLITADFPYATVAALEKQYRCPVVYISGAVGGLMSLPGGRIFDAAGKELREGTYEYAEKYGQEVAALATKAVAASQPIALTPLVASSKSIAVPVQNSLYRAARAVGVLKRDGLVWRGDFHDLSEPMVAEKADLPSAVESEVAYLRLGELHVACIPGELYPELVYGKFQEPVEPDADYPDSPKEPAVAELMPGPKWLLVGLANDEVGYIIPRRQWDKTPPYAYGKDGGQYGEVNSCGADVAPIIMQALKLRIAEAGK
ncbi:MAG TPA: neutral/alkaline non-lysosomal ceramidase N-terminal domain-containing protein [Pirellulaceae bacterium]|nr:neutral/alkaline non-lysosomal ceramidase N-terminal domain-containing protein [Pirellulaceae bacterium]